MYAQYADNGEQYTERKGAVKNTAHQYNDEKHAGNGTLDKVIFNAFLLP